jgi:glucose/arabinose dehydrogenase/mono/diheme cytochrome c family protein
MKKTFLSLMLISSSLMAEQVTSLYEQVKALSPAESMKTIQVPEGYKLQVVASEPMITEPVDCVWDANGDMYVIEMKTYMQDANATGQFDKTSRVMKLTDTDGDGTMDKSSVFIDGLMLPRMILPLDDRILVCETNTFDIYSYRDTNGDGKSDEKKIWFKGGRRGGNMEHQASGLIWNMDNWIYTTKSEFSLKIVDGKVQKAYRGNLKGQWGLGHDDDGNLAIGAAGYEKSFEHFQNPVLYSNSKFPNELEKDFNKVWPIDNIPDTQGGHRRLRKDNTLNNVTAACGQTVYRGELMPEFYGNYLLAEPVGRLIRMAKVDTSLAFKQMRNAYPNSEFIRSTDANFRPVNLKTGPDGALYIVDMYRGIIQEANWTKKGSYLRGVIDKYGLAKNIQMGRIYRLIPKDYSAKFTRPDILNKSSEDIIPLLAKKNGWMRSTARKVLILRNDKSIAPQLKRALSESKNTQEKIELLWTLEGLQALDPNFLVTQMSSNDERLAVHAMRASEPWLKEANKDILASFKSIINNSQSNSILTQAFLSLKDSSAKQSLQEFFAKHHQNDALKHHFTQWNKYKENKRKQQEQLDSLAGKGPIFQKIMTAGDKHYKSLCFACHGANGEGSPMAGTDTMLAPPFKGSKRVLGNKDKLIKIALHGLMGPVDGKTYPGAMESLASHDDRYISEVLTYIRNSWGNSAQLVSQKDVKHTRKHNKKRKAPWTLKELK